MPDVEQRRRGGMPSKGPRQEIKLRVPVHTHDAVVTAAHKAGLTVTDYLIQLIDRDLSIVSYPAQRLPLAG